MNNKLLPTLLGSKGAMMNLGMSLTGVFMAASGHYENPEQKRKAVASSIVDGLAQVAAGKNFALGILGSLAVNAAFYAPELAQSLVGAISTSITDKSTLSVPFSQGSQASQSAYNQYTYAQKQMESAYGAFDGNQARVFARTLHSR